MESQTINDMPGAIDRIFERFNKRAEMLLAKYDRSFADLEDELKLSGQLKIIQKRKEKLRADLDEWNGVIRQSINKEDNESKAEDRPEHRSLERLNSSKQGLLCREHPEDEESKDNVSEKELIQAQKTRINNASQTTEESESLQKKLQLSIKLAAKYKEQVIDLEGKLNATARSEHYLRLYLHQAAQKEEEAKKRLEMFITGLLERAENAEEKVKVYKKKLRGENDSSSNIRIPNQQRLVRNPVSYSSETPADSRVKIRNHRLYSSSAPTTPLLRTHRKPRRNAAKPKDDNYVAQFLEPPSSQELPRRWAKMKDRSVDQLPGVDLTNIIDTAIVWPFSDSHNTRKHGNSDRQNDVVIRRRIVLFCVFAYLDTEDLLKCAMVCREWRDVSKHPKLWTRISFDSKQLTSEFLVTMSAWCKETCYLSLTNIRGRNRLPGETSNEYSEYATGSLEDGMECLLQACGTNLSVLSISNCDPFLTRRVVWMASCYNRDLKSLTFRSSDPINAEVTWSLGSGCHKLLSLDIAPMNTSKNPELFNNRVVQMVSWCWPCLRGLSIGGKCIDRKGLLSIVTLDDMNAFSIFAVVTERAGLLSNRTIVSCGVDANIPATNCRRLQVLELTYMNEITEDLAKEILKKGLYSVRSLILTHTPIRPRALACLLRLVSHGSLEGVRVQLSFSDYCPSDGVEPAVILDQNLDRSELFDSFNNVMQSLMRMQKKPEYNGILEIICTA